MVSRDLSSGVSIFAFPQMILSIKAQMLGKILFPIVDRELLIDPSPRGNCVHLDFLKLHYI